ncbi:MAG: hypothetical protein A6D92_01315 [Symbiobacterium thermophilum]|uniref:Uncharacterized protein n=1 Tax=Symbiobacterium thermophilum TaxID=2734 RepID=A0A1Y2T6V4_SYMTR|nr:MAG: hypothetical protein A6D92_01315 [Symbiobacterium thermophilum]
MDSFQLVFLFVAFLVLVFTVLKWVRLLRKLDAALQAAQEAARRERGQDAGLQDAGSSSPVIQR